MANGAAYLLTTRQGALYRVSNFPQAIDKEHLLGKSFVSVKDLAGNQAYINISEIVSFQPMPKETE